MKRMILGTIAAVLVAGAALAQDAKSAITGTIQSQLDAFQVDDFATAFTFASPTIKRLFGSPDNFGLMVRRGYPMVWRPGEVQFLELESKGGIPTQRVLIFDLTGVPHLLEYQMIQTEDGWQINGVRILPSPDVGA